LAGALTILPFSQYPRFLSSQTSPHRLNLF
jgi:hypothetical protein